MPELHWRPLSPAISRLFRRALWEPWLVIHRESLEERDATRPLDWRPLVVLVTTALTLTLQEYIGRRSVFRAIVPDPPGGAAYAELAGFTWWAAWRVITYVVLPAIAIAAMPGEHILDYGLTTRGFTRHVRTYGALLLALLPLLVAASTLDAFQLKYPLYALAGRSALDFAAWEALYALQFLGLEFFFRGFMLHGLKRAIGAHAIWVMVVPYCMIHYGKPVPETLGAIVAGLVLGTVALRTGSIWLGVLIHCTVGLVMDVLCL